MEDNIRSDDGDGGGAYNVFFGNVGVVDVDGVGFVGVGVLVRVCADVDDDKGSDGGCWCDFGKAFGVVAVLDIEVGIDMGVGIVRGRMGTEEDDFVLVVLPVVFALFCDKPLLLGCG